MQLGVTHPSVHSTRLKEHILGHFPQLKAFKEGRDILMMSSEDIGSALRKACASDMGDDALTLAETAKIVRRGMMESSTEFKGTFTENCQAEAVPPSLITLVAMLLYGANINGSAIICHRKEDPVEMAFSLWRIGFYHYVWRSPHRSSSFKDYMRFLGKPWVDGSSCSSESYNRRNSRFLFEGSPYHSHTACPPSDSLRPVPIPGGGIPGIYEVRNARE